jgi:hypothetical protein
MPRPPGIAGALSFVGASVIMASVVTSKPMGRDGDCRGRLKRIRRSSATNRRALGTGAGVTEHPVRHGGKKRLTSRCVGEMSGDIISK